jgi:CRISPR/Cas system CSM-associated protein Csm3 (group 7 of RAMP superfamily)
MKAQWQNPRGIQERIIVCGTLVLDSPTHLGNGDAEGPLDMPLILDPLENRALLTGASMAGALRNYIRGYSEDISEDQIKMLFGDVYEDESVQSLLIVDDALGAKPEVELRDGVAIDPKTRTAEAEKKFDIELLTVGTEFDISFELQVLKGKREKLLQAFAIALNGLEKSEIHLGKRKHRGFGKCHVSKWSVCRYDMTDSKGLIAWLDNDNSGQHKVEKDIASLIGVEIPMREESTDDTCVLEGTFIVDGSILIRSDYGNVNAPDYVHLTSKYGKKKPILSGTSLAGALRARALRISNTLGKDGIKIVDNMFGNRRYKGEKKKELTASRLWVEEAQINDPLDLVLTRVKIDRFTGGSFPAALFNEQPIFGRLNGKTTIEIQISLEKASESDVGLLLLLLKDLWTGDLPLGGESSVGRGRLRGMSATLTYKGCPWELTQLDDGTLRVEGDRNRLETFVSAFVGGD